MSSPPVPTHVGHTTALATRGTLETVLNATSTQVRALVDKKSLLSFGGKGRHMLCGCAG